MKINIHVWNENITSRESHEMASCLIKYLSTNLSAQAKHLLLYSDACGDQNRTIKMAVMLNDYLQKSTSVKSSEQRFIVPGHSFSSCDENLMIKG